MALSDSFTGYVQPCVRDRSGSVESAWLSPSDFGECYFQPSDTKIYPYLVPVYNGKTLNIRPGLIHASLSGISIKHYYGKCNKDSEEDTYDSYIKMYNFQLYGEQTPLSLRSSSEESLSGSPEAGEHFSIGLKSTHPICVRTRINFRNSFWNIHRPELCKLTWPQKYVSTATVTEHLHEHLITHGTLCAEYHEEEDRIRMLNKELDEYVRLKVIYPPRDLPPDEIFFNFKTEDKLSKALSENRRCRRVVPNQKTTSDINASHYSIDEKEDIHRSKEEFCITIGKHIRKPPMTKSVTSVEDMPLEISSEGEEGEGFFYFDWFLGSGENSYEHCRDESSSETEFDEDELVPIVDPCPPLTMDDFCRAATKADFRDLRCDPDF